MKPRRAQPPPEVCPACGARVPETALACPECGADDRTGWNEEAAVYDGIDLPDQDFDYDGYVEREFGVRASGNARRRAARLAAAVVAAVCIVAFLTWLLSR